MHELIIANNGKPSALMIEIKDENLEDVLSSIRQAMAMRATDKFRLASIRSELSELTEEEIEAEITGARQERRG